jgi:transglutaminase-like putative cysteine protease
VFERTRSWSGRDVALFGLALSGPLALLLAWGGWLPWALLVASVLGLGFEPRPLPRPVLRGAERVCWVLLFLTGLFGLAWTIYPLVPAAIVRAFPRFAGYSLCGTCAAFLAARRQWDPRRALVPAALGALLVVAFDPLAPLRAPLVLGATSLVMGAVTDAGPGRVRRAVRVLVFAAAAGGLAVAVMGLLPWAQPFVESVVVKMIESPEAVSGFSLESRLGSVGELTLSPRVLMHVTTGAPTKLRAAVFTRFDGIQWRPLGPPPRPLLAEEGEIGGGLGSWLDGVPGRVFAAPGAPLDEAWQSSSVRTRIVEVAPVAGALPAPSGPLLVRRGEPVQIDAFGILGPPSRTLETYAVVSLGPGAAWPAPMPVAAADEREFTALPADLDPRLAALAARLRDAGDPSPSARLARTVAFVRSECHYSLKPGRFRTRQPVAEFLFDKKKGYCEYFASATAVLLRLQGIPTRYVRGFTVREANRIGGHFVVREADAHAWVEVLLPDRGWVEADATPAAEYDAAHGGVSQGGLDALLAWLSGRFAELRALFAARAGAALAARLAEVARGLVRGRPGLVTLTLALLAATYLARRLWPLVRKWLGRRRARARALLPAAAPELAALLARTDRLWARHGRRRPLFRAPLEHLASIPQGALPPAVRAGSERVVEAYYRGRFAGHPVTAAEVRALNQALEAAVSGKAAS